MIDSVLTILESHRAHLWKVLAMMRTGTMTVRLEGKDGTAATIEEYQKLADDLDAAIRRHQVRNA